MEKEKRLQEEIDRTLEVMDHMEYLQAGPYFYTRLESKLCAHEREKRCWFPNLSHFLDRGLRPVFITLLIVINVISTLFFLLESKNTRASQEECQVNISLLIKDYSLTRNTYDIYVTKKMISEGENK